jgi:hypothetical protein
MTRPIDWEEERRQARRPHPDFGDAKQNGNGSAHGGEQTNVNDVPHGASVPPFQGKAESVGGAAALNGVHAYLGRFVVYPSKHAQVAHTLWIAHTHLMEAWDSTPRIAFMSEERNSGKTRALEVTDPLVPSPVHAVNVTPAYLFRKVGPDEDTRPTILYDEVDTLFGSKAPDTGEVRALLNAGRRKGAVAGRCIVVGKKVQTEEIPAYCAVALAGLRDLPDTISSRSILIEMLRRAPDEQVEPFRPRIHAPQARGICGTLTAWCASIAQAMQKARPDMPDGVSDRDADCWEPLLALADAAGGDWPKRARDAAIALVARGAERAQTSGVQLLSDLYDVFEGVEKMATEMILEKLRHLPESAWADIRGKPLDDRGLAVRLRRYHVKPKKVGFGEQSLRGYVRGDFYDAWKRFVLPYRQKAEHAEQAEQHENDPEHAPTSGTEHPAENSQKSASVPDVPHVPQFQGVAESVPDVPDTGANVPDDADRFRVFRDPSLKLQAER